MPNVKRTLAAIIVVMMAVAACGDGATTAPTGTATAAPTGTATTAPTDAPSMDISMCDEDEFGCIEIAAGDPIRIGTAFVITGPDADLGLDSQYGAKVAAELKGEVMGRSVEFNDQDDGCGPEGGTAAARALTADPTIVAIIGTSCSGAGVPASEIASGAGVLMISPSNTAPSLTDPETHDAQRPFYARTAHNDKIQGAAMAQFACDELEVSTAATIHDGSPYAEQLQQVFADEFEAICGGTITTQEAVGPQDPDFRPVLTTIAAGNPELIYYPIFTQAGALVTQQARDTTGLEETYLAGADGMFSQSFLDAAGDSSVGMYLSGPDLEFSGSFYEDEFLPAYYELAGVDRTLSVFHAHSFDAANIVFAAIEAVAMEGDDGTLYISRTALKDAVFATSGFQGITGTLTCDAYGDCADASISVSEVTGPPAAFNRIWP